MKTKNSPEQLLKEVLKLDPIEFIGVCQILGIDIYKHTQIDEEADVDCAGAIEQANTEEFVECAGPASGDPDADKFGSAPSTEIPKDFNELWIELCDAVDQLSRQRRRNLGRLLRAVTKDGK